MKGTWNSLLITLAAFSLSASFAQAEILAMVNYETKPEQLIRKEGLAIIDVDP
ncbi:MAG: YncE family protein, partial [Nitrospirae bacterium]